MPKAIPDGYHSVTPYLMVKGAAKAIDFYKKAFGAKELYRMEQEGRVGHSEIEIGNSRLMLADEVPERGYLGPQGDSTAVGLLIYTEDVDSMFDRAVAAGAKVERPLANQFYGDRTGTLIDPFGHRWYVATHVEDVSEEEIERRLAAQAH